jgi:hypothetical protein
VVFERLNLRYNGQVGSKNTNLVENLKEINHRFHTYKVALSFDTFPVIVHQEITVLISVDDLSLLFCLFTYLLLRVSHAIDTKMWQY